MERIAEIRERLAALEPQSDRASSTNPGGTSVTPERRRAAAISSWSSSRRASRARQARAPPAWSTPRWER